jgi:hypothetical protein
MTQREYKTQLLFLTLTKNKTDAGIFTQDWFRKLKIAQWVAGLIYHQPYNCRKLVG